MRKKIRSVLVTGGAGYVGARLIPQLLDLGFQVKVFDWYIYGKRIFGTYHGHTHLSEVVGDIRNKESIRKALENIDAVIHLACISNDPSFELDPHFGKSINFDATVQLINVAQKYGVRRFIYASSSSVYGVKSELEVTEELPLDPLTDYSKYKALCEEYLLTKNSDKFTALVLRPATVCGYSPRQRLDLTVNILTIQALVNKKITVFGGAQLRPNIHIKDMIDLYSLVLTIPEEKISGQIFNAGYENYSILSIAEMIKKTLGDSTIKIEVQPTNDLRSYKISSRKILKELRFRPTHTVEEAILDLKNAYVTGKLVNAMTDDRYYNIRVMKKHASKISDFLYFQKKQYNTETL